MEKICGELQKIGKKAIAREPFDYPYWLINVPPGTSKSTICTLLFPAWLWAVDPSIVIIAASYSALLSGKQSRESRDIVMSQKYIQYFPHVKLRGTAEQEFYTTKKGGRITTSTGGKGQGLHAHIIILDDPQTYTEAISEAERDRTNSWFDGTLPTRMKDKGKTPIIIVQQRLHPKDLTEYILSKGIPVGHICLPSELNETVLPREWAEYYKDGLLDPIRLSQKVLDGMRGSMGSKAYQTQINQNPSGDENSIIKEAWLPIISKAKWAELIKTTPIHKVDFFLDTAYTEKATNDPTAIIGATMVNGTLYITCCEEQWLEFPELLKFIKKFVIENGYTAQSRIKVEPKASGKSVVQTLKADPFINISESESPTTSKLERLNSISAKVEAMKVCLVEGYWNDKFINQVTQNDPPHDDIRDTFIMAVKDKLIENNNSGTYKNRMGFA